MGERGEKGVRATETDKSPRKAPRLEPLDSACGDPAEPDSSELTDFECPGTPLLVRSNSMDVAVGSDASSEPCRHFLASEEETELLLAKVESLKYGPEPVCEGCMIEFAGVGQVNSHRKELIMVCTQCDQCLCAGVANREDQPRGHTRLHARKNEHWVAVWIDKPRTGYCFFCDDDVHLHTSGRESDGVSSVNNESMSSEVENKAESGHAHASVSNTDEGDYVIRGIPNIANTCYMNALVQCLLALDKLWTGMLGPNAPNGSIGMALKELFVEIRASNDARVNPRNLLKGIRALDPKYNGSDMHDSHELLCSLRK